MVYDGNFDRIGFMTENGRTFRIRGGEYQDLDYKAHFDALRILLGGTARTEVTLHRMPRPRTLESDAEAAAEAAKRNEKSSTS